jgi:soluble lytic murein transglycosylase-like protein
VKDGNVVFTNTPSEKDARPVHAVTRPKLARGLTLPVTPYDPFIERVARENSLDPALIKAVALVESGFNPKAVSNKGARGLMQLMPATAKQYGVANVHDPYENLRAGAQHLRGLLDEWGGDVRLALAAYNAGSGAVRRYGGVPAYKETRSYVAKIESSLGKTKSAARPRPAAAATPGKIRLMLESDGSVSLTN